MLSLWFIPSIKYAGSSVALETATQYWVLPDGNNGLQYLKNNRSEQFFGDSLETINALTFPRLVYCLQVDLEFHLVQRANYAITVLQL